eukprot:1952874-Prymnesium_polylepis.1
MLRELPSMGSKQRVRARRDLRVRQGKEPPAVLKLHGQRAVFLSPGIANCMRLSHFLRYPNANAGDFSLLAFPSENESFLNPWVASLFLVER